LRIRDSTIARKLISSKAPKWEPMSLLRQIEYTKPLMVWGFSRKKDIQEIIFPCSKPIVTRTT